MQIVGHAETMVTVPSCSSSTPLWCVATWHAHVSHVCGVLPRGSIRVVVRCWRPLELVRWTHVGCRLANKPYTMDPKELGDFQVSSHG
jgi:hypothetical protein